MTPIFPKWTNKIPLAIVVGTPILLIAVTAFIWYYFSPRYTDVGYAPKQPVPYSHKQHVGQLGMDCRYCHQTVENSSFAAVPPTQTCMGCHKVVQANSPRLAKVRESYETKKPIDWVNVHMLPDYSHFPHNSHVNAGVSCKSCHGRVDQMIVVEQKEPLNMQWCLDCHRNPTPNLVPRDQVTNLAYDPVVAGYDPHKDPKRTREVNPPVHCSGCHY